MRLIDEDDVKRSIRKVKRDWMLCTTKETETALKVVEGGLLGCKTIETVQVVRCKECKHRNTDKCPMRLNEIAYSDHGIRGYSTYMQTKDKTKDDGFCYLGERRQGEDECSGLNDWKYFRKREI